MKRVIIRILLTLIVLILIITTIYYFRYQPNQEWKAFYIACCGGVLVVNLCAMIFLVNKNIKDKGKR